MGSIPPVKPSELPSYGSLFAPEQDVLRRWLKAHESEYERFEFNVRIGPGYDPGPGYDDAIRRMAQMNSQRRIDAIAYKGTEVTIIEVKRRGSFAAIGQLIGYETHWSKDHPGESSPKLLLICGSLAEGTDLVAARAGVTIAIV
jgi:hypothetical protein